MSHTNSTTNYNLPQFLTSDKPAWLTDVNNAYSDIDTAIYNAQTKADTAFTDAGNAQTDATTAINNAAAADAKAAGAIASIESAFDPTTIYPVGAKVMYNSLLYRCIVAVVTPGPWTGSDNWERITVDSLIATTDSKIGSLTSLSTTDKTSIVNAVNEVNGKVLTATTLDYIEVDVTFDNTGEGVLFVGTPVRVFGCKDLTSDSKYVGYVAYYTANNNTMIKSFNRGAQNFTSNAVSETRKVGVYYAKYIE